MAHTALILDYDKTLYNETCCALDELDLRINMFLEEKYGFDSAKANRVRLEYHRDYGTTLKGLMENYDLDPHEYFDYIHGIDPKFLPGPDRELNKWLLSFDIPIYIFSNARKDWVEMGLNAMGLNQIEKNWLKAVFDIQFCDWEGKPHVSSYKKVEAAILENHPDCRNFLFADDNLLNLAAAKRQNWTTIWIRPPQKKHYEYCNPFALEAEFEPDFSHNRIVHFSHP